MVIIEKEQSSKSKGEAFSFFLGISVVDFVCQDFPFYIKLVPVLYTSWKPYNHGGLVKLLSINFGFH